VKLLIDMNLSPLWVGFLEQHGFDTVHWSAVENPRAPDTTIMEWARAHSRVVLTHDLDFSRLLALTRASGPSVLQVRTEDVLPSAIGDLVVRALEQHAEILQAGAIAVVDPKASRARILPI
jgi:predicted nuclease of predicted toxin-antitoxin system